ncbi:hypothetical protein [[Mycoplasma] cavipharyngis]|uniref:hypothetical protein n=1 Tax=[Mycoplasma] cavipharyngis TaxID=92757 RepID=UPI003703E9A1
MKLKKFINFTVFSIIFNFSVSGCFSSQKPNLANNHNLKIGLWNIANYQENDHDPYSSERAKVLSDILFHTNLDLLVVVEPTYHNVNGFNLLIKHLNKNVGYHKYQAIISLPSVSKKPKLKRVSLAERYGFIYNKNKLKLNLSPYQQTPADFSQFENSNSPFDQNGSQLLNDTGNRNVLFFQEDDQQTYYYTRAPGAVQWTDLVNNKTFVTIAAHFSSPGAKVSQDEKPFDPKTVDSSKIKWFNWLHKTSSQLGSNEAYDALKIPQVVSYFSQVFSEQNLFFMADTNIKYRDNFLFQPAIASGLKNLYPLKTNELELKTSYDQERGPNQFRTTLSSADRINQYANQYDKIWYQTNQYQINHWKRFNLWSLYYDLTNDFMKKEDKEKIAALSYPEFDYYTKVVLDQIYTKKIDRKLNLENKQKLLNTSLKEIVSDHTMIYFEMQLK